MNDTQIADFVRQVKDVIERYYLDGVNLWDEDSKYGKAGMPEMNTTSYPKLIKALREALPDKVLTLVDKGDATEYFYDVNKCGGIEVGHYMIMHGTDTSHKQKICKSSIRIRKVALRLIANIHVSPLQDWTRLITGV